MQFYCQPRPWLSVKFCARNKFTNSLQLILKKLENNLLARIQDGLNILLEAAIAIIEVSTNRSENVNATNLSPPTI